MPETSQTYTFARWKELRNYILFMQFCCVSACARCDIELAILLDSSTKTNVNAWTQMRSFVADIVRWYNINSNCVRAAVVRYSTNANVMIRLNTYSDVNSLAQAILQLQYVSGSSNLAAALNLLQSQVFNIARSGARRVVIIVTDQLQSSTAITSAADSLKSQGIIIVAVGITREENVQTSYISTIVSNGCAVLVNNYNQIASDARSTIIQQQCACPAILQPVPSKCMHLLKYVYLSVYFI